MHVNDCEYISLHPFMIYLPIYSLLIFREYTIHGCYGYVSALRLKIACWGCSDNKHHFRF